MDTIFFANNEKEFDRQMMKQAFANEVYEYDVAPNESFERDTGKKQDIL